MALSPDSTLVDRVVEAPQSEQGPRPGGAAAIRAIVIHMAEGGGTASHLKHEDGNSSHYVVEYSGNIVQMVAEKRHAGSINPGRLRSTNTPFFKFLGERLRYGKSEAVRALGGEDFYRNPNTFVIAIEVEGFAKPLTPKKQIRHPRANPDGGPTAKQRKALDKLVADIRSRRNKVYPCLGHRDFQKYKACPGRRMPWADYGGHAVTTLPGQTREPIPDLDPAKKPIDAKEIAVKFQPHKNPIGRATLKPGIKLLRVRDGAAVTVPPTVLTRNVFATVTWAAGKKAGFLVTFRSEAHLLAGSDCTFAPNA
jgi:N-acetyl-anhydromuramyl-L-alanine amidase AmpD